jgi:hypothetical protein
MFQVGLEPTISVFERAMVVHALPWAATVIGHTLNMLDTIMKRWGQWNFPRAIIFSAVCSEYYDVQSLSL